MESAAEAVDTRPLGQVLAAERERQGLARADVAQRLHMSPSQVEALEVGDYSRLPRGTFLRGFVRNYARLLHLEPERLLPLLAEGVPHDKAPGIVVPSEKIRFDPVGERLANPYVKAALVAFVLLMLGFAGLYWWLFIRPTPPAAEAARKPAAAAQPSGAPQQVAVAPVGPAETPPPVEAPKDEAPKSEGANGTAPSKATARPVEGTHVAPSTAQPAASTAPPAGEHRLAFRFSDDSWVEIRDARGRTLMSKLNSAGSQAEVTGRAPFTVIVGNAPGVQMTFDDRPYDLQPHSRVGVARLTVQ